MNVYVISCFAGSLLVYLSALSYHMHYVHEAIHAFQCEKIRFYQTEALLAYGLELYKKNNANPTLIKEIKAPFLGKNGTGMLELSVLQKNQIKISAKIMSHTKCGKTHSFMILDNTFIKKATIIDWIIV